MQAEPNARTLLIVEDDAAALRQMKWTFSDYRVCEASDRASALEFVRSELPAVVLLDLGLPPDPEGSSEGLEALREIMALSPSSKVIVVTGREEHDVALEAVRTGAYDFYRKPVDVDELLLLVGRAARLVELEAENRRLALEFSGSMIPGVIAASPEMSRVCAMAERVAEGSISILFSGETGTGKEVLARAVHHLSGRSGAFVPINCTAIPENLLESELFGYERGAFTGAVKSKPGCIEQANGGTLLLDEVGDMPIALQPKLLRFLEEHSVRRLGGQIETAVDARIISATHRNLLDCVAEGSFREDLYYRLAEVSIEIPPLRERPQDTILLAEHFFERFRGDVAQPLQGFEREALAAIARHDWPGNGRELRSRVKRAVLLTDGPRIEASALGFDANPQDSADTSLDLKTALLATEQRVVARAWAETNGNISQTGKLLGVSRPTVYKLLRDHGLKE